MLGFILLQTQRLTCLTAEYSRQRPSDIVPDFMNSLDRNYIWLISDRLVAIAVNFKKLIVNMKRLTERSALRIDRLSSFLYLPYPVARTYLGDNERNKAVVLHHIRVEFVLVVVFIFVK